MVTGVVTCSGCGRDMATPVPGTGTVRLEPFRYDGSNLPFCRQCWPAAGLLECSRCGGEVSSSPTALCPGCAAFLAAAKRARVDEAEQDRPTFLESPLERELVAEFRKAVAKPEGDLHLTQYEFNCVTDDLLHMHHHPTREEKGA